MKFLKDNPFIVAFISAVLAAGAYAVTFREKSVIADTTKWSEFGGYIGGVLGPAFGLVSIYLLLDTLRLQKQALLEAQAFQREQLKRDLAALAATNAFQAEQQRSSSKQSFEQTFFSWLHSFRDLVRMISTGGASLNTGLGALKIFWTHQMHDSVIPRGIHAGEIQRHLVTFREGIATLDLSGSEQLANAVHAAFERMFELESHNLASMFRTLYRLIKWIDGSELSITEKREYVGIVRSQVSSIELQFLFFNALSSRGEKFAPLINKYAFFDNFESSDKLFSFMRAWDGGRKLRDSAFNADLARSTDLVAAA